jgi:hypothetical protein
MVFRCAERDCGKIFAAAPIEAPSHTQASVRPDHMTFTLIELRLPTKDGKHG